MKKLKTYEDFVNESYQVNEGAPIELTFVRVDPDTGNLVYKGSDDAMYVSVEGQIHDVTDEGEPNTPVRNVKIKDGEPEYDPADRFARKLEKSLADKK